MQAAKRMVSQQARQKRYYDKRIRSTPSFRVGEYVFIDNPPSLGKSMADRLADEPRTKLSKKTSPAYKVKAVTDVSVTVDRNGIEDKVSMDRVTRAPEPLDPETLKTAKPSSEYEAESQEGERQQDKEVSADPTPLDDSESERQAEESEPDPDSGEEGNTSPQPQVSEKHPSKVSAQKSKREYVVQRLIDYSPGSGSEEDEYRVRWWRYSAKHDTWEKASGLPSHFKEAYHRRAKTAEEKAKQTNAGRRGRRPKKGRK